MGPHCKAHVKTIGPSLITCLGDSKVVYCHCLYLLTPHPPPPPTPLPPSEQKKERDRNLRTFTAATEISLNNENFHNASFVIRATT